jgi:hypothetical protein
MKDLVRFLSQESSTVPSETAVDTVNTSPADVCTAGVVAMHVLVVIAFTNH